MIPNPQNLKAERSQVSGAVASTTISPNGDQRAVLISVHWTFLSSADITATVGGNTVITFAAAVAGSEEDIWLAGPAGEAIVVATGAAETGDMVVTWAVVPV